MRGMAGRVAIVTGGAAGIGRAAVERLLAEGVSVVIADIDVAAGQALIAEVGQGARLSFVATDVSQEPDVEAAVAHTLDTFHGVDYLVNCAAAFIMRGVGATVGEWRRVMDVNIMGAALAAKHASAYMSRAGGGAIVNVVSISGHVAQPGLLTYSTTKGAVASLTRCLALELADVAIRVNAVSPGTVWNLGNERFHREVLGMDRTAAEAHPDIGGRHMLKRTADPDEIASSIAFLLSDEASFITGANLMVDAGYTAM